MEHLLAFLGRLHPLMVHLPIGILALAVCLHFLSRWPRYAAWQGLLQVLWFAGAVAAVLACGAGLLLKASGGYDQQAVDVHQYLGLALAGVAVLVLLAQSRAWAPRLQTGAVAALALLLVATGHYGGNLTHGEDYLSQPLFAMLGQQPDKPARPPIPDINQALVYRDLVEPILEQKCWQCHSAQKQKGDLRLDAAEFLLQGGEHGSVLTAGNAGESELYKRLLLPEDHDKRMPPKGKPQLTVAEVQLIYWWISQGQADFKKKVADLPKDDHIRPVLAALGARDDSAPDAGPSSEVPAGKVARPDPAALRELERLGAAITFLTPDQVFLAVNLGNAADFTDAQLAPLLKLPNQVLWLDLSETGITDKALPHIARLKHLTRLKLDNTAITDAGLVHLRALTRLRALNLYGTGVTDRGLEALHACKNLETLYLWRTQVTQQGAAALQHALGDKVEINFGYVAEK